MSFFVSWGDTKASTYFCNRIFWLRRKFARRAPERGRRQGPAVGLDKSVQNQFSPWELWVSELCRKVWRGLVQEMPLSSRSLHKVLAWRKGTYSKCEMRPVWAQASISAPDAIMGIAYFYPSDALSDALSDEPGFTWTGVGTAYLASLTFSSIRGWRLASSNYY